MDGLTNIIIPLAIGCIAIFLFIIIIMGRALLKSLNEKTCIELGAIKCQQKNSKSPKK